MKIKGVIKNLNLKKLKSDNSKNIPRNFFGAVVGSVGSVQSPIVPCSSLYLFSRSIGPLQCLVNVNSRVFIYCTCHFQRGSLFFVYFGSLCLQVSSVSNFHSDTRGRRWSLFQAHLSSRAVGREEHCKQISLACVGSASSVSAVLGFHPPPSTPLTVCVLSQSTLLRLQVALPGNV